MCFYLLLLRHIEHSIELIFYMLLLTNIAVGNESSKHHNGTADISPKHKVKPLTFPEA